MIKEFTGMTLEDAVMETLPLIFLTCQKTGTLAGLMRERYISLGANAPKFLKIDDTVIVLNPDDFETDVDGYAALLATLLNNTKH